MAETLLNIVYCVGVVALVCFTVMFCLLTVLLVKGIIQEWKDWRNG